MYWLCEIREEPISALLTLPSIYLWPQSLILLHHLPVLIAVLFLFQSSWRPNVILSSDQYLGLYIFHEQMAFLKVVIERARARTEVFWMYNGQVNQKSTFVEAKHISGVVCYWSITCSFSWLIQLSFKHALCYLFIIFLSLSLVISMSSVCLLLFLPVKYINIRDNDWFQISLYQTRDK